MQETNELEMIAQIRSKVKGTLEPTGENLFLVWGYPTAIVLVLEFLGVMLWHARWYEWLWVAIPLVGGPLMAYFVWKDYLRTGHRTLDANTAMQMWMFVGFASCLGGFTLGFSGLFEYCYCAFQGLLVALGCFVTGVICRFRSMKVCGILASVVAFASLFFQGDLWPWQLLIAAFVAVIALIIPGHLLKHNIKNYGI